MAQAKIPTDFPFAQVRHTFEDGTVVKARRGDTVEVPDGADLPDGWEPVKAKKSDPAPKAADAPQEG